MTESNIGHTLSCRTRVPAVCPSLVWWHMVPSAMPVSSRRLPAKNVSGQILGIYSQLAFCALTFQIWWSCEGTGTTMEGTVPLFVGLVPHFFGRPSQWISCVSHKVRGLLTCGTFQHYSHKDGEWRKWKLNAVYRAEFSSLEENVWQKMSYVSGEDECWLITGPVLLRSDSFWLEW